MKTLQEQFVPYNLAIKLKELGFDEDCFGWYSHINGDRASFYSYPTSNSKLMELNMFPKNCSAPLWSQVFDWFEEQHKLYSICENIILDFGVTDCRNQDIKIIKPISHESTFKTKLEIKTACLEFLIEILQNEKHTNR